MIAMPPYQAYPISDHALTLDFGAVIDMEINQWVIHIFRYFQQHPPVFVKDIIPAYSSITFIYDPYVVKRSGRSDAAYNQVLLHITEALRLIPQAENKKAIPVRIPVCYHESLAPDLASLAARQRLAVEEVISIHTAITYRVFMLGFLPGFAYMGTVDKRIASPRLSSPRTIVPAGSVGIAGVQTGIYPLASPGGWQLIGQTPVLLFDAEKENPCLLQPGDEVQFYRLSLAEFKQHKTS